MRHALTEGMAPEALKRAHEWIEVREDLLSRVKSLDPKLDANDRNIRPMYAHLLLALRRATITLIRMIADGQAVGDGQNAGADDDRGCFMWKGINYLAKICEDTAFLENVDELQRYFGVTFHDNPLVAEETLSGLDARVQHDSRGTRWDLPPRRRSFFAGLDSETVNFVYGVLRQAQKREQKQEQGRGDAIICPGPDMHQSNKHDDDDDDGTGQDPREGCPENPKDVVDEAAHDVGVGDTAEEEEEEDTATQHTKKAPPSVDMALVHEFALRVAARRREKTFLLVSHALREWSSLTARLRKTRARVNHRFEQRERVREVACQREFLVCLKNYSAEKERAREAATTMIEERRVEAARAVMLALATNLERGRSLDRSAGILKKKLDTTEVSRNKSRALAALTLACEEARVVRRKAEEMRAGGLTRMSLEAFGAWARAAGLAGRLRKRLGRADRALLENVISAWALFSKHSAEKRLRKEERTAQKTRRALVRAWDTEILDEAFFNWANLTAAAKFHRLRLSARALRGWAAAARALSGAGKILQLSREKREVVLASARREAEVRFERATRRRLADVFESWARGAGLSSRLRRRLGKSEMALVRNAFSGWKVFATHSMRRREARLAAKARQRRDADTLRGVLWAWVDVTAADKFFRVRLGHQVFTAWRNAVGER